MLAKLIDAFWVFLPAGLANVSPILGNKIPLLNRWNTSLDMGKSWRGKRLLGDNKRLRGLVLAVIVGALGSLLIQHVRTGTLPWPDGKVLLFGALLGFGALAGDAVESFFKRQAGIKPGQTWFPLDQLDYIVGGLLVAWPLAHWSLQKAIYILVIYFGLHLLFSYIGYALKLKDKPI